MTALEIVKPLIDRGFLLWLEGEKLRFKPTPDAATIEILRQHKAEVIAFLAAGNALSSDQAEELREERAAILEYDGGLSRDEAEARAVLAYPCTCQGRRFWVSKYGAIRCGTCHPPADPAGVVRWFEL